MKNKISPVSCFIVICLTLCALSQLAHAVTWRNESTGISCTCFREPAFNAPTYSVVFSTSDMYPAKREYVCTSESTADKQLKLIVTCSYQSAKMSLIYLLDGKTDDAEITLLSTPREVDLCKRGYESLQIKALKRLP